MQLSLWKILFGAMGDMFLVSVSLNQVRLARCTWVRPSYAMGGERCLPWSISSQPAILHASLLSCSVLLLQGESAHTFKDNIIYHSCSFSLSLCWERKLCQHLLCCNVSLQRKRKCDGGDVLLQEGGSRCDCHALPGASGCCGMLLVTCWLTTVHNNIFWSKTRKHYI